VSFVNQHVLNCFAHELQIDHLKRKLQLASQNTQNIQEELKYYLYIHQAQERKSLEPGRLGLQEPGLLLRWAKQAAKSLVFCHSYGVLHGDINCSNFFLDHDLNIKLGDFSGSSIDHSPILICYSTTHQLPDCPSTTEQTEIFAFGSTLYEMATGYCPYDGKADLEVEDLFRQSIFPDVSALGTLGRVILKCWRSEFECMTEVLESIKMIGMSETIVIAFQQQLPTDIVRSSLPPPKHTGHLLHILTDRMCLPRSYSRSLIRFEEVVKAFANTNYCKLAW
jgi:serine/threonine protein kinase